MFKPLKRPNCKMIAGDAAYIGMTGLIVDKIDNHFRIILDKPQGDVTEGRWLPREVALIRPPKGWLAPVGFEAAMSAMPELPVAPASAPAAEPVAEVGTAPLASLDYTEGSQQLPAAESAGEASGEAGEAKPGPDTAVLDTAIAAIGGKGGKKRKGRKDGKPKALSAKAEAQQRAGVKVTDEAKA